jgi:hypothetical protein
VALSIATGGIVTKMLAAAAVTDPKLADGAVTKPKLSATGGTAGQVLGTDGSKLVWQDDGLMLPYSSDGNSFSKFVSLHHFSEVSSMAKPAIDVCKTLVAARCLKLIGMKVALSSEGSFTPIPS